MSTVARQERAQRPGAAFMTLKWILFPGMNLHARLRYRRLPVHFSTARPGEKRRVLDAGCGNGMLSYQSYLKGSRVTGISIKDHEVSGCRALFNRYLGLPEDQISFRKENLYDTDLESESYDEILCAEVLEHIKEDDTICRKLYDALKTGGVLHVTAPNAAHPYNAAFCLDLQERGGHVRPGYTLESFRALLEPIGFRIEFWGALGGPIRQGFNRRIKELQARRGAAAGLPLFLLALPCLVFENKRAERERPFSIYVRAVKT